MSDLPATLVISRDDLAYPNNTALNINDPANGFTVIRGGLQLGSRQWRRQATSSPFTNTRTLVARTVDVDTRDITIRCRTVGTVTYQQKMNTLAQAFSQFSYTLDFDLQGVEYGWLCETADWSVGQNGTLDEFQAMANQQEITFHVPIVRVLRGWM